MEGQSSSPSTHVWEFITNSTRSDALFWSSQVPTCMCSYIHRHIHIKKLKQNIFWKRKYILVVLYSLSYFPNPELNVTRTLHRKPMCTHIKFKINRVFKQTGQVHVHWFVKHLLSSCFHHQCAAILNCFRNVLWELHLKDNKVNNYSSAECPKVYAWRGGNVKINQCVFNTASGTLLSLYVCVALAHVTVHCIGPCCPTGRWKKLELKGQRSSFSRSQPV